MTIIQINIPEELKKQADESNINLSELLAMLLKRELIKQKLLKKFNSKEEKELTEWSVKLGRKAKKERLKKILSELSTSEQKELPK